MIKLNRDYSDYTDLSDPNYPNGKAMDCSTDESYDGTPVLQSLVNDVKGALESVVNEAEGNLNGVSGNPDNIAASDFLNALKKLISTPDAAHAGLRGTDAHGATVTATAGQLMARDANGRSKIAAPAVDADISNKKYVDDGDSAAKNLENATGTLAASHGGTGYTSLKATRNAMGLGNTTGALPIANGGTGATTAAGARNALGLGNTTGALPVANGGTGATDASTARTNLGLGNVRNEAYSVPVGFTYFQLPGEKDPTELFPSTYIWAEITDKFSGLFFRAEGGNAKSFATCNYKVKTGQNTQTDYTLNLESVAGISVGDKIVCICADSTTVNKDKTKTQVRTVSSIVDTVVTFTEKRTYSNFTNVIITQKEGLPDIQGSLKGDVIGTNGFQFYENSGAFYRTKSTVTGSYITVDRYGYGNVNQAVDFAASQYNGIYGSQAHVTPQNTSIKIWKRTA